MHLRVTLQLPLRPSSLGAAHALTGSKVLLIGYGYVAQAMASMLRDRGANVRHTSRDKAAIPFGSEAMRQAFSDADIVLISVPPGRSGSEPTLAALQDTPSRAHWIGYLSATSVYGDRQGGWAFEGEAPTPHLARGKRRADAELAWLETYPQTHIFRLAGIYGPGRDPFTRIRSGTARIIEAPGHVVNRIHVDDIVSALMQSIDQPSPQDIYNLADGHPAPPGDVLHYAATLIDKPAPPIVPLNDPSVSDMARSFYKETKRIDIKRAQQQLGWSPQHPTYQDGLRDVLKAMEASTAT